MWSYEQCFLNYVVHVFFQASDFYSDLFTCMSGAAGLISYSAVSKHFQVGVAFTFSVIEHGRFEKRSCCPVGIGEGQAKKNQAPHRQIARS